MKGRLNGFLLLLLILFIAQISFGQERTLCETVMDENHFPLPGVNILIESISKGIQTEFDGNYNLEVDQGQTLVFSFIGFQKEKRVVSTVVVLNISLTESSSALDEVEDTAFGRKMTGNEPMACVSSVSSEDIQRIPQADAREALEGKLPGIVLQESETVDSKLQIRIKGQNSITANNEPLYLIDGIPVNSGNVGVKSWILISSFIKPNHNQSII